MTKGRRPTRPVPVNDTIAVRFWSKVDKSAGDDGCWIWKAGRDRYGYGRFRIGRKEHSHFGAHRVSYTIARGQIPQGMCIDHLCCNPACVNPSHMEATTSEDNVGRGKDRLFERSTHCVNGHAWADSLKVLRNGQRKCKTCLRDATRRYRARITADGATSEILTPELPR